MIDQQKLTVYLDGNQLTPEVLVQLGQQCSKIQLTEKAQEKLKKSRKFIDDIIEQKKVVYGVNTGFGNFANILISDDQLVQLQNNLIKSHSCGVGQAVPLHQARMFFALRINVLAKGYSGISIDTIQRYIDGFNLGIYPKIPEKGTVGASGDLAPLSHLALGLMGEGEVYDEEQMKYVDAKIVLEKKKFQPIVLKAKEGLALINGTQFITSIGSEALIRAENLSKSADIIAALTFDVMSGDIQLLSEEVLQLSGQNQLGVLESARRMRELIVENGQRSQLNKYYEEGIRKKFFHDSNTILCIPQVHGILHDTLKFVRKIITEEINSATDNPLVFSQDDGMSEACMISGGNFHGEYISKVLDYLTISLTSMGSMSERRIEKLVNSDLHHEVLSACLIDAKQSGLNNGFMIAQYIAAALTSENKTLSHPASSDTIPTAQGQEDHVSMGGWSARKCLKVVENIEYILAIELMSVCQAIDMMAPQVTTQGAMKIHKKVREIVPTLKNDYIMSNYFEKLATFIREGHLLN